VAEDLREIQEAEDEIEKYGTIPHEELMAELGL